MLRLEVPLVGRILWATGDILLHVELDLLLKDRFGLWQQEAFLVDTGSEMTTMPALEAKQLDLAMPQRAARGAVHAQTGLEVRSGYLRVRVLGMDATEYALPCLFLGDPDASVPLAPGRPAPRKLLGLGGVVDKLRFTFDGTPGPGAQYGSLVIEKV